MNIEDEQLIKACLRRDQKACKQLYDRFAPAMYAVCLRYSPSVQEAEDALHDAFIKVFDNLKNLKSTDSLFAWMHSLAVHTAISNWRRYRPTSDIDSLPESQLSAQSDEQLIYDGIDINFIISAVQQLPHAYRLAFNLCDIEGYHIAEAALILKVSEVTVRSNLSRARRILAEKLKKNY